MNQKTISVLISAEQKRNPRRNKTMGVSHPLYTDWFFRYTAHKNSFLNIHVKHVVTNLPITSDLNAKGVILQAFEEYRLRSCVDFKPYEGESSYISFTKLSGWVAVSNDPNRCSTLWPGLSNHQAGGINNQRLTDAANIKINLIRHRAIAHCCLFDVTSDAGHLLETTEKARMCPLGTGVTRRPSWSTSSYMLWAFTTSSLAQTEMTM